MVSRSASRRKHWVRSFEKKKQSTSDIFLADISRENMRCFPCEFAEIKAE